MREDDIKNPRTRKYSNTKYFFIVFERFIKKIFYIILSLLNFSLNSDRKKIFIGKYKDSRFIEYFFYSLSKEYDFVYEFDANLSNLIKKIGIKNFFKFCKEGTFDECNIILKIDENPEYLEKKLININTDYFFLTDNNLNSKHVIPYYMYPKIYSKNYTKLDAYKILNKKISIIFSGSTNEILYNRINWKNNDGNLILNRNQILKIIEHNFLNQIKIVNKKKDLKNLNLEKDKIYLFKNEGLKKKGKSLLSTKEHLINIARSEFIITAPGTEMPLCHHFIEALKFGTIPITNYGDLILPKLDKKFYLEYSTENELVECIKKALNMSEQQKLEMREGLIKTYDEKFSPNSFLKKFNRIYPPATIYANNDHDSVRLREKRKKL